MTRIDNDMRQSFHKWPWGHWRGKADIRPSSQRWECQRTTSRRSGHTLCLRQFQAQYIQAYRTLSKCGLSLPSKAKHHIINSILYIYGCFKKLTTELFIKKPYGRCLFKWLNNDLYSKKYNFDYLVFAKNSLHLIRDWIKYREFI